MEKPSLRRRRVPVNCLSGGFVFQELCVWLCWGAVWVAVWGPGKGEGRRDERPWFEVGR